VIFGKLRLQIPEHRHRRHFVRASVTVLVHPDGSLAVHHGPRRLATYDSGGRLMEILKTSKLAALVRPAVDAV
jgi:hypothetical protein